MRRTVRQLARRWPTEEVPWEEDEYRQLQQAAVQHPLPLEVPPRARRGLLAVLEGFLRRMSAPETLSTDVAEALVLYRWPFNVRELEQVVTASTLRAQGCRHRREGDPLSPESPGTGDHPGRTFNAHEN